MDAKYKVSVLLITYNHEKYIAKAIESVLFQKTTFPVELVIGDDRSSDKTLELVQMFKDTQNITIRILDRINNREYVSSRKKFGYLYNFTDILKHCKGQYVSILDGDDYFTDPEKLQKQVDFLDANPDYSACFHNAEMQYENGDPSRNFHSDEYVSDFLLNYADGFPSVEYLFGNNIIPTASCVFRNTGIKLHKQFYKSPFYDWPVHILNASRGKIKFLNEVMSVYRIHCEGAFSKLSIIEKQKQCIRCISTCNKLLKGKYKESFYAAVVPFYHELFKIYSDTSIFTSFKYGIKLLTIQKYGEPVVSIKDIMNLFKMGLLDWQLIKTPGRKEAL